MEHLDSSILKEYPPLRLYLDDLRELVAVVSDVGERASVATKEYRFGSIDELRCGLEDEGRCPWFHQA